MLRLARDFVRNYCILHEKLQSVPAHMLTYYTDRSHAVKETLEPRSSHHLLLFLLLFSDLILLTVLCLMGIIHNGFRAEYRAIFT
jgi:hypothetical protein